MEPRDILAMRLRSLMAGSGGKYSDRGKLARAAGVSPRNIGYMLEKSGNPTLKSINAVAGVFRLEAWELLIDHGAAREKIMGRIFGAETDMWQHDDPDRRNDERRTGENE